MSIGKEHPVYIWDTEARVGRFGSPRRFLNHEVYYPSVVAVSEDGKRVASADWGGWLYVWDPESLETIREFPRLINPDYVAPEKLESYYEQFRGDAVLALEFFPDGRRLAVVTQLANVIVLDVERGSEVMRYRQPGGATPDDLAPAQYASRVVPLAVSPDGRRILYSMHSQPVRLLDAHTGELIAEFQGHTRRGGWGLDDVGKPGGVRNVAFSPDGELAVTGGDDGTIRTWVLPVP